MANFFTPPPASAARAELFQRGRATMQRRLATIIGDGARVDATPEQIVDTETGRMLDRFTAHISRPLSMQARATLTPLAANVFAGESKVRVDVDWSRYDTRWLASEWTTQQRALGALAIAFALVLLGAAAWFEHYRVAHLGGESMLGNCTVEQLVKVPDSVLQFFNVSLATQPMTAPLTE